MFSLNYSKIFNEDLLCADTECTAKGKKLMNQTVAVPILIDLPFKGKRVKYTHTQSN